jgi:hypothetical protein
MILEVSSKTSFSIIKNSNILFPCSLMSFPYTGKVAKPLLEKLLKEDCYLYDVLTHQKEQKEIFSKEAT